MTQSEKDDLYRIITSAYSVEEIFRGVSASCDLLTRSLERCFETRHIHHLPEHVHPLEDIALDCGRLEVMLYIVKRLLNIESRVEDEVEFVAHDECRKAKKYAEMQMPGGNKK